VLTFVIGVTFAPLVLLAWTMPGAFKDDGDEN
jgi:hypothetical protein